MMDFYDWGIWVAVDLFFIGVFVLAQFMGAYFLTQTMETDAG